MQSNKRYSLSIPQTLFDQLEVLSSHTLIPLDHLLELAVETLVRSNQAQALPERAVAETRIIHQGDLYWAKLPESDEVETGYAHPQVVIQEDVINHSRVQTVVVCSLTSNNSRANLPGNVTLAEGEANLPRQSVVEVSKVSTVDKTRLGEYIGTLPPLRIHQILEGMRFVQRMMQR